MNGLIRLIRYCMLEARPAVLAITLLRYLVGILLADSAGPVRPARVAAGAAGLVAAAFAVYVFNGVTDRREDVANGSRRPIATGALPARSAARAAAAGAATALGCGALLGTGELAVIAVYLLVGYAYSGRPFRFKNSFGTVMPSVAVLGLAAYFGGALAAGGHPGPRLVVFAAGNALWMAAVGGISKDLSDVPGDRIAGRSSWPIVLGLRGARVALRLAACAVALAFGVAVLRLATELTGCAVVMLLGAAAVAVLCGRIEEGAERSRCRLPYRAFMWTQHTCHLVLLCSLGLAALFPG
jgi:4-hydroxybenzoate polyprenyltransferase